LELDLVSDEYFHLIRKKRTSSKKAKVQFLSETNKKKSKPTSETTAEEKKFLKQITHLESTDESSEKSGSSSDAWDAPVGSVTVKSYLTINYLVTPSIPIHF
jgi:hypothetical protein